MFEDRPPPPTSKYIPSIKAIVPCQSALLMYACPAAFKNSWHCHNIPLIQGVHRFSAPWESNLRPWWRAAVSNLLEKYRRGRQVWTGLFESYSMTLTTNNLSLMTLPCCHSFHDACVIAWLSKAANCPLCRLNSRRLKFLQHNHSSATFSNSQGWDADWRPAMGGNEETEEAQGEERRRLGSPAQQHVWLIIYSCLW